MRTWHNSTLVKMIAAWGACFVVGLILDSAWPLTGWIGLVVFFGARDPEGALTWRGLWSWDEVDQFFEQDSFFYFAARACALVGLAIFLPIICFATMAQGVFAKENEAMMAAAAELEAKWMQDPFYRAWRERTKDKPEYAGLKPPPGWKPPETRQDDQEAASSNEVV